MSYTASFPISSFLDVDGKPLENGYVWIGVAGSDPVANPISVYWDDAATQLATQPIRTIGGYPSNAGVRSRLYISATDYSVKVTNVNGADTVPVSLYNATEVYAADVNFLQAGTGAVVRTAQDKLREMVSVKDFGAVGDGVADDRAAIVSAIAAATNIYFPAGTYKVSSAITVPSNRKLFANTDATLDSSSTIGVCFSLVGSSQIVFDGLKFYGPTTGSFSRAIDASAGCSEIVVQNCRFNRYNGGGVVIRTACSECKILNCTFVAVNNNPSAGADYGSIALDGATECLVSGNTIVDFMFSGISSYAGKKNVIANNVIKADPASTASMGIFLLDGVCDTVVEGNFIEGAAAEGIIIGSSLSTGAHSENNTISGNNIKNCRFVGISLEKAGSDLIRRTSITGNSLTFSSGLGADHGIFVTGATQTSITGNTITDESATGTGIDSAGITLASSPNQTAITGNVISGAFRGITAGGDNINISTNNIHSCATGVSFGLFIRSTFTGNSLSSCTTAYAFGSGNLYSIVANNVTSATTSHYSGTPVPSFMNNIFGDRNMRGSGTLVAGTIALTNQFGLQEQPFGEVNVFRVTPGGTTGALYIESINRTTGAITITSTSATDTSVVGWRIVG